MNNDQQSKELLQLIRNASAEQLQDVITHALSAGAKLPAAPPQQRRSIANTSGVTPPGADQPAITNPGDQPK